MQSVTCFRSSARIEGDFAEFQKAIAIVQLALDTGTAISGAIATAASTSLDPLTLVATIASVVSIVTANILKAKKLINSADVPNSPSFRAYGGYTDLDSIRTDRGRRSRPAT